MFGIGPFCWSLEHAGSSHASYLWVVIRTGCVLCVFIYLLLFMRSLWLTHGVLPHVVVAGVGWQRQVYSGSS